MKPRTVLPLIILLGFFPAALLSDSQNPEITHGSNNNQASEARWWDIPYPDRFDSSRLSRDQELISVSGNGFVTGSGASFIFRGVNIADPGKLTVDGGWNRRLFEEIHEWGANTIRIPVHPLSWRKHGADWYFDRIDEAVIWANSLGMYLVIDWHSIGNLETGLFQHPQYETSKIETLNFWKSIAHRYKDVPTTAVYEFFNEPTDNFIGAGAGSLGTLSWEQWRETLESLVDLVQVYDPTVISLVGGLNWAYDLGPVAELPVRREGVAYAAHAYPQKAKPDMHTKTAFFELWQEQWAYVAETYPIIATEIGWVREDGYNAHIPVINNDGSYGPNIIEFMRERGISWTAWCFDPDWSPTLISDWDFTPTEQGRFFKDIMQRERDGTLTLSVLPSPRVAEYSWMSIARWQEMHAEDIEVAENGRAEVLFLGDSITEGWPDEYLVDFKAANFGIGGDMTQNLLWRLRNGAAGRLDPEVVVVMIGVNNFGFSADGPQEVFLGVRANIAQVKSSFPDARIVLLGILPYGEQADTPERLEVIETNARLAGLAVDPRVEFHDIGPAFLESDGSISTEIMADFLHPTEKGYALFARELEPILNP
jgi:lysophospholipase L1-like esterase